VTTDEAAFYRGFAAAVAYLAAPSPDAKGAKGSA
jgi:hypothetical protein